MREIEMVVRTKGWERVYKLKTSWPEARWKMEKLIFDGEGIESVLLADEDSLTEMRWVYTSEDGNHVEEYSVHSDDWLLEAIRDKEEEIFTTK